MDGSAKEYPYKRFNQWISESNLLPNGVPLKDYGSFAVLWYV